MFNMPFKLFSPILFCVVTSCESPANGEMQQEAPTPEAPTELTVLLETEAEIDMAAEKFLGIPESEITERDVLEYVDGYQPARIGFGAFRLDSALHKALVLTSTKNFKRENYIINTLLLKQTLFNAQNQCFLGYNMNMDPKKDPAMEWLRKAVAKELSMKDQLKKELFLMSVVYHFIKENPENNLDYDTSYIHRIDLALDSCDRYFLVD